MHDHEHAPRVDRRSDVGLATQVADLGEIGRALEPGDQVAPGRAVIFVEDGHPHVLDLLRGRERENEHLDDRRHDEDACGSCGSRQTARSSFTINDRMRCHIALLQPHPGRVNEQIIEHAGYG